MDLGEAIGLGGHSLLGTWIYICCYLTLFDFLTLLRILISLGFSNTLLCVYKCITLNIFSDLRKPGLVPGKSLSLITKIDSVLEKNQSYIMSNRIRSIHKHLISLF